MIKLLIALFDNPYKLLVPIFILIAVLAIIQ
jgi:hypothetical protein